MTMGARIGLGDEMGVIAFGELVASGTGGDNGIFTCDSLVGVAIGEERVLIEWTCSLAIETSILEESKFMLLSL